MRAMVSLFVSLAMIWGPVRAEAQNLSASAGIYASQVGRYNKAKAVFAQKGVSAFVATYSTLISSADSRFITSKLSSLKGPLPELRSNAKGFELSLSDIKLNFDLSNIASGYVLVDGAKIVANFGGSVEEIVSATELVLKQKYPSHFSKGLSAKILNLIVTEAHASNAVIIGAIVAIIGALIFKGVADSKSAAKKKEAAKKPAFVEEPVSYRPGAQPAAGQQGTAFDGAGAPVGGYEGLHGPQPRPPVRPSPGTTPPARPQTPAPPLNDPPAPDEDVAGAEEETAEEPEPQPIAAPDTSVAADDYKSYKDALCKETSFAGESIGKIMSDILDKHAESFAGYMGLNAGGQFLEARRTFIKSVLANMQKIKSKEGSKSEDKAMHAAYVSFINKNFKPDPKIDPAKSYTTEDLNKIFEALDARNPPVANFIVEPAFDKDSKMDRTRANVEIAFAGGSPIMLYKASDSSVNWSQIDASSQIQLCKDLKFETPKPETAVAEAAP
jgi:hypothetical protein